MSRRHWDIVEFVRYLTTNTPSQYAFSGTLLAIGLVEVWLLDRYANFGERDLSSLSDGLQPLVFFFELIMTTVVQQYTSQYMCIPVQISRLFDAFASFKAVVRARLALDKENIETVTAHIEEIKTCLSAVPTAHVTDETRVVRAANIKSMTDACQKIYESLGSCDVVGDAMLALLGSFYAVAHERKQPLPSQITVLLGVLRVVMYIIVFPLFLAGFESLLVTELVYAVCVVINELAILSFAPLENEATLLSKEFFPGEMARESLSDALGTTASGFAGTAGTTVAIAEFLHGAGAYRRTGIR